MTCLLKSLPQSGPLGEHAANGNSLANACHSRASWNFLTLVQNPELWAQSEGTAASWVIVYEVTMKSKDTRRRLAPVSEFWPAQAIVKRPSRKVQWLEMPITIHSVKTVQPFMLARLSEQVD